MAHLILPSRRIVQPPGAVEVDWTNPLTRGLVSACKTTSKLTTSNQLLSGGATVSATDNGLGFRFNGSNYLDYPSRQFEGLVNGTFSLWFRVDSFSSTYCIAYEAGNGFNNFSINTPATASSPLLVNVGSNTARYTSKTSWIAGRWYNVIASWGDAIRIYIDGNSEHETITSAYPSGTSSHVTTLGSYNIGSRGEYLVGDLQLPVLFNRALSTAEVKSLSTNPWQIFRPRDNRIYFDVGAGAPAGAVLEGAAAAAASSAGALTTGIPIAGAALSVAAASGALSVGIPLSGAAASMSSASGTLTTQITLAGSALAQAVSSALLDSGIVMTADAVAQAAAQGTLDAAIQMLGGAQAQAGGSGSLTTSTGGLKGNAQASASAAASLTTQIHLSGAAIAQAGASGSLGASANLAGAAVSIASASGELTVNIALTAQALASAIAQGSLTAEIRLAADAAATAGAGAQLSGGSLAAHADILLVGRRDCVLYARQRQCILKARAR